MTKVVFYFDQTCFHDSEKFIKIVPAPTWWTEEKGDPENRDL